jgi:hypothetical protein
MQGAPKRQVNAEDMLAELKRALESSTPAPEAQLPAASTVSKSSSPNRGSSRPQIDRRSDRPAKANVDKSIGPRIDRPKSSRSSSRPWKWIAGGLTLAGAAAICVSFALMNKAPDLAEREPPVAATESQVRPQNEATLEPSAPSRSAAPEFTPPPPNQPATLVASHRIGRDGAPIATAPSGAASPDSAPPLAEAPKTEAATVASQAIRPDAAPTATSPPGPASRDSSPPLVEAPKTASPSAASQAIRPDGAPIATPPAAPASAPSTPRLAEAPKTATPSAASQAIRPGGPPIAPAPPNPASTASAPVPEPPKPSATRTASVSDESAEPSTPKIDSKKKPPVKPPMQKPHKTANAPAKPDAEAERRPAEPAPPKEAEKSPQPAQDAGSPTALAPVKTTSVQQRVADGVTHAFGYLVHLPGALVPHFGGPNPDTH